MNLEEKVLYHQIHPIKLATDWGTTPLALYFFWRRKLLPALLFTFAPPILASFILIRFFDLESYKHSRVGRYVNQYMTPATQAMRVVGAIVMTIGAWYHRAWLIPSGLILVLVAWLRGVILPRAH